MPKASYCVLLLGLVCIVTGFFYDVIFAGIPYQDPTPEMQQSYDFHAGIALRIETSGLLILATGFILWIAGRIVRGRKRITD